MKGAAKTSLPMPPWMDKHGETEIVYYADTGGNDAYEAECQRHYTRSGPRFWTADDAQRWRCPQCEAETQAHEAHDGDAS